MEYILFGALMFTGGFVDAIAGGGGLITIPAYMSLNIPLVNVMGTNKLSASMSTLASFIQYLRSNRLRMRLILKLVPFSLAGSMCGVALFYQVQTAYLEKMIPFMIMAVGVYSLINKNLGTDSNYVEPSAGIFIPGAILTFFIGMYDGFFGPGTGIFFMIALIKIFKLDFVGASGGTRLLNYVSGLTAFVIYFFKGAVLLKLGLIGFSFSLVGSLLGSHLAIKNGAKFIKPIFVTVSFALALKLLLQR